MGRFAWVGICCALLLGSGTWAGEPKDQLESGFANPPRDARLRAYWWWLNGNVTKQSITRDLEEMAAKGFGGALICDAGGAEQDGNARVPHGPDFFSPQWRELYKHALREASRLNLEMSLNIQSGWNLGGPMVKPEDAPKKLVWSELGIPGGQKIQRKLDEPKHPPAFYRDVVVLAYPAKGDKGKRQPILNWEKKALITALPFSAPDTTPLLQELPDEPGEEDAAAKDVLDLTGKMAADGTLTWDAPEGNWEVLRIGCTLNDHCRVSTCSDGWQGYALDPFDADAFMKYWNAVVEPLIADAGELAGKTLRYLHTDSWEVEVANWTPTLREEFRRRRGYDLLPYLPIIAGKIIDSRSISNRFLHDFRRTMGDLAVDNHFRLFKEGAHRHGLEIHPESGGPHAVPVDSLRCLGMNDAPMSEFWAWSWRHRVGDANRFFVKQPASAAHTNGRRFVLAEGFTTIGPHWQETLWDNLKPAFDHACCEGLNRLVWHAFTCSPAEMGLPGQEYFAGTHFNPNSTWWSRSASFLAYINRCQYMLQRGLFVADACYYYGDHVPNFAQLRSSDPAGMLPGHDYDVVTEEVILTRMSVKGGRIVLPDGMSYGRLVLPDRPAVSLPVLRKVRQLVLDGATVVGTRPKLATGLADYPQSDKEVDRIAAELWGGQTGQGKVITGKSGKLEGDTPDFEFTGPKDAVIDYIHRRDGAAEIYFVCSRTNAPVAGECTFRVAEKRPEFWDPMTGHIRAARTWNSENGRTRIPMEFAPFGSMFVVFRSTRIAEASGGKNFPSFETKQTVSGPWRVRFDPRWGGPESATFDELVSWTKRPEDGVRFYSGTATYFKKFDLGQELSGPWSGRVRRLFIDLGVVKSLAEVRLNGTNLGVVWAPPFRVEVTDVIRFTGNELEVDVVNFWPNRVIGDQLLPADQRLTRTNIRKLTKDTPLIESGLLGPVTIQVQRD